MGIPIEDDNNKEENGKKTYINTRVGNDLYIPRRDGSFWVYRNYFEGKKRKDIKKINCPYKQVGNDLHHYRYGHIFIIKDYYSYYKKNKKNGKKLQLANLDESKAICAILIILCVGLPLIFPLFNFTSYKVNFSIVNKKNEYRAEYAIRFRWDISFSIAQAFILWGDGSTDDLKKDRSGSVEHVYGLQGKYTPTLMVWDSSGKLRSKLISLKIENDILEFDIEVKRIVFEGQETVISVDNIFTLNKGLQKDEKGVQFVYDVSETQIISNKSSINYRWKNEGIFPLIVSVIDSQGVISKQNCYVEVINKDPEASFIIIGDGPYEARADIEFSAHVSSDTSNDKDSLQYIWNWGDHTNSWGKHVSHSYYSQGTYNVSLCVLDDDGVSNEYSQLITIEKASSSDIPTYNSSSNEPLIAIGTFLDEVYESEEVQFTSEVNRNMTNFQVIWSFGDGTYSVKPHPIHTYSTVGIYNVVLLVTDSEGQSFTRSKSITVKEKTPEILGPYNFQGVEGQALVLDIDVVDAINDIPDLRYQWYTQNNKLFSREKKPTLVLEKGSYQYKLTVTDHSAKSSSHDIHVIIHPLAHEVFVASYMYHGLPGDKYDSTNNTGVLKLRAYLHDYEINKIDYDFYWTIRNGDSTFYMNQLGCSSHSEISFKCTETTIYQGEVKVVDSSGKTKVSIFQIYSFIDSTHDGINDEYEQMLQMASASSEEIDKDYDNDHLSDIYEMTVSHTDYSRADSDSDGLYDGYDDSGVGELTFGTDPLNFDTDGDLLNDGREYFGWDVSINYFENRSTFQINSDPLVNDTDNDGLSDYEEYNVGTNPRLADSDCDKLLDLYDPYPTTWDQDNDLLSDFMELKLGTDINASDSDMDGLKDGEEIYGWGILNYQTSPIYSDSDGDFLDDFAEILNYNYDLEDEYGKDIRVNLSHPVALHFPHLFRKVTIAQISFALTFGEYGEDGTQSYGVQDQALQNLKVTIRKADDDVVLYDSITNSTRYFSYVIDITDTMNERSLNYYGDYEIEVKDLNNTNNVPKCILEQFEIQVSRYLNPNDEDTDNDGIFDGLEMGLLVEGIDKIDFHNFYNSTVSREDETEDLNEFFLEIPQTGRYYDGNLVVDIQSENVLLGSGNISIQILKQHVNRSIEDTVLLDELVHLEVNHQFSYYTTLDISQYINLGIIPEYCGKYLLRIIIQHSNPNDNFFISEFYIETETYVQAGPQDSHAWITDPFLIDSDEDGWSDSYEIFTSATNPINKDTDGDSVWDPNDRDPFRNIMIEIRPISATFANQIYPWPTPKLEIIVQFQLNDLIDPDFSEDTSTIGLCTTTQHATTNPTWWGAYQTAWWTDGDGHHYYYDISDDKTIQSNTISFSFQLWQMLSFGDVDIFGEWLTDTYSINDVGHFELFIVENDGDKVRCIVETIAIEKANTIAIFNPNNTDFTGHYNYNEQERMNLIQLHIDGDCDGTPFNPGPNMIIIPTSLFTKTLLNSYFQKEQLEQTPLYSSETGLFECYSIDRDGSVVEEQCGDSDMVFIRYNITAQDALEILESLLICVVNETTNEQQKVLDCVSTKLNGTMAGTLNLPQSILLFIPWIADIESSPFGRTPEKANFLQLFTLMLLSCLFPVLGMYLLVKLTITVFSALFKTIADTIGMVLLTFLASLLWIVIRTALLVMFYVLLAIELLTTSLVILPVGLALMALTGLMGMSSSWGLNWYVPYGEDTRIGHIKIEMHEVTLCIESWVNWIYWDFFDLYIPLPDMDFYMNTTIDDPSPIPEAPSLHCGYNQIGGMDSTKFDFYTLYQDANGDPPEFVWLHLIAPDGSEVLYSMGPRNDYNEDHIHLTGIEYNKTIDFKNRAPGQWFYYFITKEISTLGACTKWPIDYFCEPGPYISPNMKPEDYYPYLLFADVDRYSGLIDQDFEFTVTGADFLYNKIPNQVFLNILWSNGDLQSLLMESKSAYTIEFEDNNNLRNVTFTTYSKSIDFSLSNYISSDKAHIVRSYYSAEFVDGDTSILFDHYEDRLYNKEYNLTAKKWFDKPYLIPINLDEKPMIVGWKVEEVSKRVLADNTLNSRIPIGPIFDEQFLRFWVFISDPNGDHSFHMQEYGHVLTPKLILKNCDSINPIDPIDMVWGGKDYDPYPECDAYFIDILPVGVYTYDYQNFTTCDFGPGAWTFNFSIIDHSGNIANQIACNGGKSKKIWLIGSANQMWDTAWNGYDISGNNVDNLFPGTGIITSIGISLAFIGTAILSMAGEKGQTIARYLSIGILLYDIINSFIGLGTLLFSQNTGTLLGMGLGALVSTAGFTLAHSLSGATNWISSKVGLRGLNMLRLNLMAKVSIYVFLANLILSVICNPTILLKGKLYGFMFLPGSGDDFDWELPGEEFIKNIPIALSSFLVSVISLGAILNIAEMKSKFLLGGEKNTIVGGPVSKAVKWYSILKIVVSTLCIVSFIIKTGMCYVIGDFYANPAIAFGEGSS